jgi:hypothetical protein
MGKRNPSVTLAHPNFTGDDPQAIFLHAAWTAMPRGKVTTGCTPARGRRSESDTGTYDIISLYFVWVVQQKTTGGGVMLTLEMLRYCTPNQGPRRV